MTYHLFADALLARGLSACGLKEANAIDPSTYPPMPHRNAVSVRHPADPSVMTQSGQSANPTAWHVLLNTH
jgi:hypothetical protein